MIVYCATNIVSGKKYIGKTMYALEDRRASHEKAALGGSVFVFHCALRKYGFDNFKWEILDTADSEVMLNDLEVFHIWCMSTMCPNGYNMTKGGDGVPIGPLSDAHKQKISRSLKGRPKTDSHNKNVSKALLGKPKSIAHRQSMSRTRRGRKLSEKHRRNIGLAGKGRVLSEETKRRISEKTKGVSGTLKGKTYDEIYGDRADEYRLLRAKKRMSKKRLALSKGDSNG